MATRWDGWLSLLPKKSPAQTPGSIGNPFVPGAGFEPATFIYEPKEVPIASANDRSLCSETARILSLCVALQSESCSICAMSSSQQPFGSLTFHEMPSCAKTPSLRVFPFEANLRPIHFKPLKLWPPKPFASQEESNYPQFCTNC